ncbi:UNVERIFIED_CONTAM: hypothetical protein FKN15_019137 [Acipenser sinensis]
MEGDAFIGRTAMGDFLHIPALVDTNSSVKMVTPPGALGHYGIPHCGVLSGPFLMKLAARAPENKGLTENDNTEDTSVYRDPHSLHNRLMPPLGHVTHEKPFDPRNTVDAQESTKAKNKAFRKKAVEQGPCHIELSRELDKIAKSQQKMGEKFNRFHLPNCDRHGFYRAKQCEASLDGERGKCWCVYPWNGKSIPGSPEVRGDPECQQYLALQEQDQTR